MFQFNLLFVAVAILQATSTLAVCSSPDNTPAVCQTSQASPKVSDCQAAIEKLSGPCHQSNNVGSYCTSLVTVGTCKIDVCGYPGAELYSGVNCGGYLQTILNSCQSGGLVGGYLQPEKCNIQYNDQPYKLQFSHS
ncbi:hypothetical protein SERLA73DRAFT_73933 [Serpula lacrymans var. lacrymans S7.3]|uniref:Uncharacterized protein n=2 Tax=Serpula lacrymans var. lacrymans TaxID=341189 RepID=F8PX27_SERL3|nr:uncharacterized protein SERLADRAFT_438565 [Serpula lacrymans var. lacrymans S7.9]EGN99406.1 hypothetical protein SERLA73DRAFT_73933 [Serpula lacrymans var. lacrymans S7.3]EGO24970.1 hypothetical protein SERLADRAFT_438565 [Serpula lacrymans var. lacrymans S7.9]